MLYFYPKDDTPGCTIEACSFRDNMEKVSPDDVDVIGVSPDSPASHQKLILKHDLNFTLLTDESHELSKKFDVMHIKESDGQKKLGIERTTFLIDRDGIVRWIERPVSVEGHVDRVFKALELIK